MRIRSIFSAVVLFTALSITPEALAQEGPEQHDLPVWDEATTDSLQGGVDPSLSNYEDPNLPEANTSPWTANTDGITTRQAQRVNTIRSNKMGTCLDDSTRLGYGSFLATGSTTRNGQSGESTLLGMKL